MTREDHRVYSYLSEPICLFGLTKDELFVGLGGLMTGLWVSALSLKILGFLGGFAGVYFLKRLKKLNQGFSLRSFLHWHAGVRAGFSKRWPQSAHRRLLP